MTWTLEQHIIDADEVLEDVDLEYARVNLNAEVDAVIEDAVGYLPAAVRKSGSFAVDREGIVAAVRASL